ncbi:MAG: hypothetical protein HF978_02145 [Desulfobacteraceae bacterium]|nr:restriction endonuclease subunit S [Desulfobacteraceae bacterium]MBC2754326.1 hypothetical protein [Desulfobacteraceae bacterium]
MSSYEKVMIGSFLKRIHRPIKLDKDKEYKLVTIKMHHKGITLRCLKKGSEIKSRMHTVRKGDFILSGIDARNGAFGIIPPELDGAIVTNDFWLFDIDEKVMGKNLFLELTQTTWFDEICRKGSGGITQRIRLQKDKFFNQQIQLPPKANQKKLLKKISRVKADNQNLFAEITHQQTLLKKLHQSILQDAISGKLTEQWRKENSHVEPASELLKRIKEEKERLIKEKKIKKQKPFPPIREDEIPFELPRGWVWCRLGNYFQFIDYRGKTPQKSQSGVRLITAKNIRIGYINENPVEFISKDLYKSWMTRGFPERGDLLFVTEGATMGFVASIEMNFTFALAQRTINLKPYVRKNIDCLKFFIMSPLFQAIISKNATGSAATGVKASILKNLLIPIPPENERKQIADSIKTLFNICGQMEIINTKSQQSSEMLMQAVLKEAFEG